MPANIPSPIVGAGSGGRRPGILEQAMLALASSTPQFLQGYLQNRQQNQQTEAAGQAALGSLKQLIDAGIIPPETINYYGGTYTPEQRLGGQQILSPQTPPTTTTQAGEFRGHTIPGRPIPGGPPPLTSGVKPQSVQTQKEVFDMSGIDPKVALAALAQQPDIASVKESDARRVAAVGSEARAAERHPLEMRRLQAEIDNEVFNRYVAEERLKLQERETDASIAASEASIEASQGRLMMDRANAIANSREGLVRIHQGELMRYDRQVENLMTNGLDNQTASAAAAWNVFGAVKAPTTDEFVAATFGPDMQQAILTGQDPYVGMYKYATRNRPELHDLGVAMGMTPRALQFIDEELEQYKLDGVLTPEEANSAFLSAWNANKDNPTEQARLVLYFNSMPGVSVEAPAKSENWFKRAFKAVAQTFTGRTAARQGSVVTGSNANVTAEDAVPSLDAINAELEVAQNRLRELTQGVSARTANPNASEASQLRNRIAELYRLRGQQTTTPSQRRTLSGQGRR